MTETPMVSSRVIKSIEWQFTTFPRFARTDVSDTFKCWHRGKLLGASIADVAIDGLPLTPSELERLNLWIQGGGAWRCSALNYWDSWGVFDRVIRVKSGTFVGPNGAGRWCSPVDLQAILKRED